MGKDWKHNKYKQFDGKKEKGHQGNRGKVDRFPISRDEIEDFDDRWKEEIAQEQDRE